MNQAPIKTTPATEKPYKKEVLDDFDDDDEVEEVYVLTASIRSVQVSMGVLTASSM